MCQRLRRNRIWKAKFTFLSCFGGSGKAVYIGFRRHNWLGRHGKRQTGQAGFHDIHFLSRNVPSEFGRLVWLGRRDQRTSHQAISLKRTETPHRSDMQHWAFVRDFFFPAGLAFKPATSARNEDHVWTLSLGQVWSPPKLAQRRSL